MTQNKITIKGKEIDFIKELGLENMPVDEQEKLIDRMAKIVNERVILRALDSLTEEETKQINANLISGETEKAMKMVDEKVPNFDVIMSEEIAKFQEEMLK